MVTGDAFAQRSRLTFSAGLRDDNRCAQVFTPKLTMGGDRRWEAGGEQAGDPQGVHNSRISATKDDTGEWRIEPLFRLYPATATADDNRPATDEVAGLRRENELLREMIADLREDRDRWREQATRLLPAPQPAARRGWWPWRREK